MRGKSASATTSKKRKKSQEDDADDDDEYVPTQKRATKKPRSSSSSTSSTQTKQTQSKRKTSTQKGTTQKSSIPTTFVDDVIDIDADDTERNIRIVNAYTNQSFEIVKPKKYSSLQQKICELFDVQTKHIESISNLSDIEIKSDSQLSEDSTGTILFYPKQKTKTTAAPTKTKITTQADIMPHVNILIHGGDEYDFITALAELIDNSIQNTSMNESERFIDITMEGSGPDSKLHIWDNGRGMNYNGLVEWAKLGVTRPPPINRDTLLSMPRPRTEMHLTNDFSRYGVGSKKAIFNLGSRVTMCTRPSGSKLVHETTLSTTKLEDDYNKGKESQWKIEVDSRTPNEQELHRSNFTHIVISELKEVYINKYDSAIVRRSLAHIYHYYIFGVNGNNGSNEKDLEDEDDEEDLPAFIRNVTIRVDGKSIKQKSENDLESQYLQSGVKPFTFDMKVTANIRDFSASEISQTNQPLNKIQSTVKGRIYYFPYKNGKETLPIPYTVQRDEEDDIPLSERDPGFECFWNGRLLSGEKSIKSLPFMAKDKTRDIPDICYRRIKGMLFFDSAFEVSANKLYLCKQTPICQELMQFDDRTLKQKFKKWLKDCHNQCDEEIKYGQIDTEETNKHKRGVTYYKDVTYGNTKFQLGTKVAVNTRPKIIGTITAIFLDASSQDYGCTVVIKEWTSGDEEDGSETSHNIAKVEVLSSSDFKKEKERMMKRKPSHVDIMDTAKVSISEKRPPAEAVEAGFVIKWITVGVFCGDNKVYSKEYSITMTVMNETSGKTIGEVVSHNPTHPKSGKHCFKITSLVPRFTEAGKYRFEFSADKLKSRVYTLVVVPSSPHHLVTVPSKLSIASQMTQKKDKSSSSKQKKKKSKSKDTPDVSEQLRCSLEQPISLSLVQIADQYDNIIDMKELSITSNEFTVACKSETLVIAEDYQVTINDKGVLIQNVKFKGSSLADESIERTELLLGYGVLEQKLHIPVIVLPGTESNLKFTEATKAALTAKPIQREVPPIHIQITDAWNNTIRERLNSEEKLTLRAESSSLEKTVVVEFDEESGLFSFEGDNTLVVRDDPSSGSNAEYGIIVEFTAEHDDQELFGDKKVCTKTKMTVAPVKNTITPQYAKLVPKKGQEEMVLNSTPFSSDLRAAVNEELLDWRIVLYDREKQPMINFYGTCSASWHKEATPVTSGECKLPRMQIPTVCDKKTEFKLTIRSSADDDEDNFITYRLNVLSIIGPPVKFKIKSNKKKIKRACLEKFNLDFIIQDTYGNAFDLHKHRDLYKEIEDIQPIIEFEPVKDKQEVKVELMEDEMELSTTSEGLQRFQNVQVKGTTGIYELVVRDVAKRVKSANIVFELTPGPVLQMIVNGMKEPSFTVANYGCLPTLTVSAIDVVGNIIHIDGALELNFEGDHFTIHGMHESSLTMETDDDGNTIVPQLRIRGTPGKHSMTLGTANCLVKVAIEVQPSHHPSKLVVLNKIKNTMTVGSTVGPFEVIVEGENGQVTRVPKNIVLEYTGPEETQTYTSIAPSSQASQEQSLIYKFPNSDKCLTRAGNYRYRFIADLADLPYSSVIPDNELQLVFNMNFSVNSGKPNKLETRPIDFQLPAVSNAEDPDKRSFFDDLAIVAVDDYKNIGVEYEGTVSVTVAPLTQSSKSAKSLVLEGDLKVQMKNGRAKFERLSIAQNSGTSGMYKLIFSCAKLQPKELEFCFSDDTVLHEKQNKLHKKRDALETKIKDQERIVEQAKIRQEEAERQLNILDHNIRLIGEDLEQLSKDYKNRDWPTENIDKILKWIDKKLLDRKKNTQSIRASKFGLENNTGLQHVMKLKANEGDASDIVGILGDIVFVDDEQLDKIISKLACNYMQTVIVHNRKAADSLKQQLLKLNKITILPLDNIVEVNHQTDERGYIVLEDLNKFTGTGNDGLATDEPRTADHGFVGYAVNLVQLRKEHQHLRRALFSVVFSDCAIFKTYEQGIQFRRKRIFAKKRCPKIITLDGETLEGSGLLYAGEEREVHFRFGQMPLSSDPLYASLVSQQERLNQMKSCLVKRREYYEGEYNQIYNECNDQIKATDKTLKQLKHNRSIILDQMRKLTAGGDIIEELDIGGASDKEEEEEMDELLGNASTRSKNSKKKTPPANKQQKKNSTSSQQKKKSQSSKKRKRTEEIEEEEEEEDLPSPIIFGQDDIEAFSSQEEADPVENWTSDDDDNKPPSLVTPPAKRKRSRR
jgi:hypothetical protein